MTVIRKDASITNTDEDFPGSFEVILSAPTEDRDGETLLSSEWKQPLPEHITFDVDHGMSVGTTVGSGTPTLNDAGELVVSGTYSSLPKAQEVRTLVNEGHIRTTSVAFMTSRSAVKGGKSTVTRELLNGAFVAIPSNREALVLSSKGVKAGARNSATDAGHIQSIYDAAVALGAEVSTDNAAKAARRAQTKAVAGSLEATRERVSDALNDLYGTEFYVWLRATIPTGDGGTCVFELDAVEGSDSDCFQQSYTDDGSVVTLTGERAPVDLMEVIKSDPDEESGSDSGQSPAAPAKAAPASDTAAQDQAEIQVRAARLIHSAAKAL